MTVATSLIPGLDEIVSHGDPRRRAEAARRITELFLQGAANFRSEHVDLFDGVLSGLVPFTEITARAELAERLSLIGNAPRRSRRCDDDFLQCGLGLRSALRCEDGR